MANNWKIQTRTQVIHLHRIEPVSKRAAREIARRMLKGEVIINMTPED